MPLYPRFYSPGELQILTASTYRRVPVFGSERFRRCFVQSLEEVREEMHFRLVGWVLMPERVAQTVRRLTDLRCFRNADHRSRRVKGTAARGTEGTRITDSVARATLAPWDRRLAQTPKNRSLRQPAEVEGKYLNAFAAWCVYMNMGIRLNSRYNPRGKPSAGRGL